MLLVIKGASFYALSQLLHAVINNVDCQPIITALLLKRAVPSVYSKHCISSDICLNQMGKFYSCSSSQENQLILLMILRCFSLIWVDSHVVRRGDLGIGHNFWGVIAICQSLC